MNLFLPKAVIFDWDSTLAQTRATVVKALEQTLAKFNKAPWEKMKKYRRPLLSLKDNFPLIFGKNSDAAYQYYLSVYETELTIPTNGAREFLNLCQNKNISLFIVSNKEKSLLLEEIKKCYPDVPFSDILAHGDAEENKPSAAPIKKALHNISFPINPQNVWLIGDSKPDVECAYNAHIQPILIGQNIKDKIYLKEKSAATPSLIHISSFDELSEIMTSL